MRCPGCGGIVGQDCWNPQECEWISRDMAARHAAEDAARQEVAPLLQRISELEQALSDAQQARRAVDNSGYAVHHINGNPHDNRPENLTLVRIEK